MTLSIENEKGSEFAMFEHTGVGDEARLVPLAFPGDTIDVPAGTQIVFSRVPLIEPSESKELTSLEGAREAIPIIEIIGKELESYRVESLPEGQGGIVNSVKVNKIGIPVNDGGIIYTAG